MWNNKAWIKKYGTNRGRDLSSKKSPRTHLSSPSTKTFNPVFERSQLELLEGRQTPEHFITEVSDEKVSPTKNRLGNTMQNDPELMRLGILEYLNTYRKQNLESEASKR